LDSKLKPKILPPSPGFKLFYLTCGDPSQ